MKEVLVDTDIISFYLKNGLNLFLIQSNRPEQNHSKFGLFGSRIIG
jgi:hypothetical protein